MRWPLQPLQPFQQTQLQPPFGPSVDSLCHPWFTTTNLSYRFPIFETSATALCGTTGIHIYVIYIYICNIYIYIYNTSLDGLVPQWDWFTWYLHLSGMHISLRSSGHAIPSAVHQLRRLDRFLGMGRMTLRPLRLLLDWSPRAVVPFRKRNDPIATRFEHDGNPAKKHVPSGNTIVNQERISKK